MIWMYYFFCRHKNLEKEHQRMIEAHNQETRTLKNKTDASLEFMKQEHNLASAKVRKKKCSGI